MSNPSESQHTRQIASIQQKLSELQARNPIVTNPTELEALEREIGHLTDQLAAAILGQAMQNSLDAEANQEAERTLTQEHPQRLKSEGKKIGHNSDLVRR